MEIHEGGKSGNTVDARAEMKKEKTDEYTKCTKKVWEFLYA